MRLTNKVAVAVLAAACGVSAVAAATAWGQPAPSTQPAAGTATPGTAPAEMVANPAYQAWAKYKPGSRVVMGMVMSMGGPQAMNVEMTQTLVEALPDKVVVESAAVLEIMGNRQPQPAQRQEIAAQVPKGQEYLPTGLEGKASEAGTEQVTVDGKAYACRVIQVEGRQGPQTVAGKLYRTDEIPGGLAKMDMTISVPGGQSGSVTSEVKSFEVK